MALFGKNEGASMDNLNIPVHVGIIMDGNGRWAKKRGLPRKIGHRQGAQNFRTITKYAKQIGIKYLTFYAFSTENWKRPQEEVDALMDLFEKYLDEVKDFIEENIRIRFIGDRSGLSEKMQEEIYEMERESVYNTGLNFTIALNYGSRDEMVRAMKRMIRDGHHDPAHSQKKKGHSPPDLQPLRAGPGADDS